MTYNLNNLNPYEFESMIQSLSQKVIGEGMTYYGNGTDGGREVTFEGSAPFPSVSEQWDGYWVIQAKFKIVNTQDEEKDFSWLKTEIQKDLDKYSTRVNKVKHPDNYIFFTNIILTAKPNTGGRDKANQLQIELEQKYKIKHVRILAWDEIQAFLDNNRDVAIVYAPFITPGDVLKKMLDLLDYKEERAKRVNEEFTRFLEIEFAEDSQSRLDHAGKLTSDKVNLEKVFVDLSVFQEGQQKDQTESDRFIDLLIELGNEIQKKKDTIQNNKLVLIAGPGHGKSTLTQFAAQIHRSYFLERNDQSNVTDDVKRFISDFKSILTKQPKWPRIPFKVTLKSYAGWITDRQLDDSNSDISVLEYLKVTINRKTGAGTLSAEEIESILRTIPSLLIFDGLDEVPVTSNRADVLSQINHFVETILRRIKAETIIIATTRPQGYSKEFNASNYKHFRIADLETYECKLFLKKLLANIIDDSGDREVKLQILEEALEHREISNLMKSPLQASIMAILVKSGGEPPRNKFDLFTEYYETIFKREKQRNVSRILSEEPLFIRDVHNRLGFFLQIQSEQKSNPSATISSEQFVNLIESYLRDKGFENDEIEEMSYQILKATTDRLVFISELEEGKIGFAIRSLQEYFAANGYIHNVTDEKVRENLRTVKHSSYWSNTLLFMISYVARYKDYLTDFIESLCHELNGSSNENGQKTLTEINHSGSWLALDILNEGIFRSTPNFENKFHRLLEPLFQTPRIQKHSELSNLTDSAKNKWLIPFLVKALRQKNINAWHILADLDTKWKIPQDIIDSNWPTSDQEQIELIDSLIIDGYTNDFIADRFVIYLKQNISATAIHIICNDTNIALLHKLCAQKHQSTESRNRIIECLFLAGLASDYRAPVDLARLFGTLGISIEYLSNSTRSLFQDESQQLEVSILDGFRYKIVKTRIKTNQAINGLLRYSNDNNIPLISLTLNFLLEPSSVNFLQLQNYLYSQPTQYRDSVSSYLARSNSFFKVALQENNSYWKEREVLDKLLQQIENISVRNVTSDHRAIMSHRKYSTSLNYSSGKELKNLVQFQQNYFINTSSYEACEIYLTLFHNFTLGRLSEGDFAYLRSDILHSKYYRKSIQETLSKGSKLMAGYTPLVTSLFFLDFNEFTGFGLDDPRKNQFRVQSPEVQIINTFTAKFFMIPVFEKLTTLIHFQIVNSKEPKYSLLIQHILVALFSHLEPDLSQIPFKKLISYRTESPDELYKALILLLDHDFSRLHLDAVVEILETRNPWSSWNFQFLLLSTLRFQRSNEYIDELLIYIERKVSLTHSVLAANFFNFLRSYIGNKPTGLKLN